MQTGVGPRVLSPSVLFPPPNQADQGERSRFFFSELCSLGEAASSLGTLVFPSAERGMRQAWGHAGGEKPQAGSTGPGSPRAQQASDTQAPCVGCGVQEGRQQALSTHFWLWHRIGVKQTLLAKRVGLPVREVLCLNHAFLPSPPSSLLPNLSTSLSSK